MKVPGYIRKELEKVYCYSYKSCYAMQIVEKWLEKHGFDIDELRDGCGCSLEELEYGNNIVDELCEKIENMEVKS